MASGIHGAAFCIYMCYKVCYFKIKTARNADFLAIFMVEWKTQNPNPQGSDLQCLVEMTGIEPVSEKRATLVSPGAVRLQDSPGGRPVNGPPRR